MRILIHHRILLGYVILIAVIMGMAAIIFYERKRVRYIELEASEIKEDVYRTMEVAHWHITVLSTLGESVFMWERKDYQRYRMQRLKIDSLLQVLQRNHEEFIPTSKIDSLRILLENKEKQMYIAMCTFQKYDSLLLKYLPDIVEQVNISHVVTRKKKGIAGFFGGKETLQVPISSKVIHSKNEQLVSMKQQMIVPCIDSLRLQNKIINQEIYWLIQDMDKQAKSIFQNRELYIQKSYNCSTSIIVGLVISAIALLAVLYWIIQRERLLQDAVQRKLKDIINQNRDLLDMRKKIILTISHDIRAPLSIINGSAELAMDTRDRKKRNSHLANISVVCKHILHLLNNLLDIYRLNEAKETRNNIPFRLSDLLERITTGFTHAVNDKGLLFQCNFEDTDVTVCGDSDRIEQIADNLLSNAIKFTEAGSVSFIACHKDGTLLLTVKDTGIGMSEETVARIFDPFERSAPDTNAEGFGLGLSITKGLVGLLDGEITVASEVGKGSTFCVSLPLPLTDETVENEEQVSNPSARLPQRVLAIDDDPLQLEIVKEMLERNGVSCTTCVNTRTLVGEMRKADYDLLLSDIQMDGTNGFDLLELLRNSNIGNSRTIPVVAMTARGDKEKEAFASAGFTACIHKPFSMHELLDLIASVVSDTKSEVVSADFDTFTAEVRDKKRLLRTFIEQSNKDIEQLRKAGNDRERLREIVHRMLPMWELLQTDEPLLSYRNVLHDDKADDNMVGEYTQQIIDYAALLIAEAENKLNEYKE